MAAGGGTKPGKKKELVGGTDLPGAHGSLAEKELNLSHMENKYKPRERKRPVLISPCECTGWCVPRTFWPQKPRGHW